jgi:hypothetical protein
LVRCPRADLKWDNPDIGAPLVPDSSGHQPLANQPCQVLRKSVGGQRWEPRIQLHCQFDAIPAAVGQDQQFARGVG